MAFGDPLPPNFIGFPLPGFCIDCRALVPRSYARWDGLRYCRKHLRAHMREALWPDLPAHLREPGDK